MGVTRRYPVAPLAAAVGLPEHELGTRIGWSGAQAAKRRQEGMSEAVADRAALKLGLTPWEVWPDWGDDALAEFTLTEQERIDRRRAQWAASARRRWANDPEHRAARATYMRAYRAEAKRTLAAQKRRWVEDNRDLVRQRNRESMRRLRARRRAQQDQAAA